MKKSLERSDAQNETDEADNPAPRAPLVSEAVKGLETAIADMETQDVEAIQILQLRQMQMLARSASMQPAR